LTIFFITLSGIFKVVFYFFIFSFSIFQNHLKDDTSCCKKNLSKFSSQNIIVHKIRIRLARLAFSTWIEKSSLFRISAGLMSTFFFKILMIKFSIFNKLRNLKLSKYFGVLDGRLIIQHFNHIHIHILIYTMYSLNLSKIRNT